MLKAHVCNEMIEESEKNELEITITNLTDEPWKMFLYDGDGGIGTNIKFCPYCGEKLV
jgi:hypothetical protein